jgi:hypothetical protein
MKKLICKIFGHKYEAGLYQLNSAVLELNILCERGCGVIFNCKYDGFGGFNIKPFTKNTSDTI